MKLTKDSKKIMKYLGTIDSFNKENFSLNKYDFDLLFELVNSNYKKIKINNFESGKSKSSKKTLKKSVRLYLNNIDTCSNNITKKKLKNIDNLILIFKLLASRESGTLQEIYNLHNYPLKKQEIINSFLLNMDKINFDNCIEWVNLNGIELLRSLYLFHLEGKLPEKINNLMGNYPHTKGEFTSLDIQNEIQLGLPQSKKYNIKLGNTKLNLLLFSNKGFMLSENMLKRCFILDTIMGNKRDEINLEIWLSNKKKILPPPRKIKYLGAKEVNSGCNTFYDNKNKVSLWRKEELPKVLVHELVHSLNLEKYGDYSDITEFVYNNFDIKRNNRFNMFENYVELIAEFLNICLTMIENRKKSLKIFNNLLEMEIKHCHFQVGKILNYFGFKKWNDFYIKNINEAEKTDRYLQKSNVFSYFILRSLIMFNIRDFMELLKNENKRNLLKQDFKCSKLLPIMVKSLNDNRYGAMINHNIDLNNTNTTKNNIIFDNLRMTCLEVKI